MIKLVFGIFMSMFLMLSIVIIYYWRDTQYDPSAFDLWSYFLILPAVLSLILLAPYFIYKGYQTYIKRKVQQQSLLERHQLKQTASESKLQDTEIQWFNLKVFSSFACNAFGENESIIDALKQFKSPELDHHLSNAYGLPVLSYRMTALDDVLQQQQDEQTEDNNTGRISRINALIQQQLVQQTEILWLVAEHLKQSALFYDSELAYQYRIHPAWNNSDASASDEDDQDIEIVQVPRLNRLNVHVLLSDNLLHLWDEDYSQQNVLNFIESLGIIPQQIQLKYHYIGQKSAYTDWLKLLNKISKQHDEVSLIINVDSEIDQNFLDEKMWQMDNYVVAEFASSWCVAAEEVQINALDAIKTLNVACNVDDLATCLQQILPHHANQTEQEQPFVLILDDATNIKSLKKNNQRFSPVFIEPHHFLYTKPIFGHTQQLAKIFSFMLGMHLQEEMTTMIYSTDQASTHAFFKPV